MFTFNGSVTNSVIFAGGINSSFATIARFAKNGSGNLVVQDATDTELIAQRLSFGVVAAGLGS